MAFQNKNLTLVIKEQDFIKMELISTKPMKDAANMKELILKMLDHYFEQVKKNTKPLL
tara:strand:- start:3512 stop:3685 length:174 start_codon:yes stop_codon:yes gene_type:complete